MQKPANKFKSLSDNRKDTVDPTTYYEGMGRAG